MKPQNKKILTDLILDFETEKQLQEIIEWIDENFKEINLEK